jgi:hypothetical protein
VGSKSQPSADRCSHLLIDSAGRSFLLIFAIPVATLSIPWFGEHFSAEFSSYRPVGKSIAVDMTGQVFADGALHQNRHETRSNLGSSILGAGLKK